ncbi:hypothetical protein LTR36_007589 [Oleoguttula mirabilis]|uniref:Metal homeostatis protein bsd2 n=1 Tax=Oleoguttula mirabilis TaxID=1507867 RepID=A0AAV9JU15_9PEZI|nr:hypothetical protein LTR36_007589 [Oleoguttula mirabilis]
MATQIAAEEHDEHAIPHNPIALPNSPPPSFRSRASSRRPSRDDDHQSEEERNLNDAFDAPSDDEDEDEGTRDQRRLIPQSTTGQDAAPLTEDARRPTVPQRRVTEIPVFAPVAASGRVVGGGSQVNDGVWANISAKPRAGEDLEEKPPTYEQAAADATPPYWETTVLSPYGSSSGNPDDVFVDSLLVGSLFSFVWNALISMSFQIPGFLLTYLLHTTHAAKHGSRAGLGITLVQYGFQMRYSSSQGTDAGSPSAPVDGVPDDPNGHDFDPSQVAGAGAVGSGGIGAGDWLAYVLMIVGWFILIRGVSDFMRARRQEALVRSSPDRGLGVAVVAEGESPETSV